MIAALASLLRGHVGLGKARLESMALAVPAMIGASGIRMLLADRAFAGSDWFYRLNDTAIPFHPPAVPQPSNHPARRARGETGDTDHPAAQGGPGRNGPTA